MINSLAKRILPPKAQTAITKRLKSKKGDRQRIVRSHINQNDTVLDVGCVQHSLDRVNWRDPPIGEWLHADLRQITNDVYGIDIVEADIKTLQEEGFNVEIGDAETFKFNQEFDVIVAGELIEHLSNPGLFLDRCYEHLSEEGRVIITTPNPRRLQMLLWFLRGNEHRANTEHTMWFDHYVMDSLVQRHGFEIDQWHWHKPALKPFLRILYRLDIGTSLVAGGYVFTLRPT